MRKKPVAATEKKSPAMKPVLFNTEMVRANLDGRKKVTRRAIKWGDVRAVLNSPARKNNPELTDRQFIEKLVPCKYEVGDILYVRESWAITSGIPGIADDGPVYMADFTEKELSYLRDKKFRWKPSIHMPRDLARLYLRVTDIRAERLRQMGIEDFIKEGIKPRPLKPDGCKCIGETKDCHLHPCPNRDAYEYLEYSLPFSELWDSTTKPKDLGLYGWKANPWVWVIRYEQISREEAECSK